MAPRWQLLGLAAFAFLRSAGAFQNYSNAILIPSPFDIQDDRPKDCPPCFNCLLPSFQCTQYATCDKYNGKCACPPGFAKEDCSEPVCGSLADGKERLPRTEKYCDCTEGWSGINCNVCEQDQACNALMPEGKGGVCYKQAAVVKQNYQMCDVTNRKIVDMLKDQKPQVTFSCNAEDKECAFQFWVDQRESFYCALDECQWSVENEFDRNSTKYRCEHVKCKCVPDRMLCGENGSIDISEFLAVDIKGPGTFSCLSTDDPTEENGCKFQEPAMNNLIRDIFGDESITLDCNAGECLYKTDVPGYERPIKRINTPLIAGVIAGCALFVVAVILTVWYLSRRSFSRYGAIYLGDESDDENAKLMADHKPAALYFEDISYQLKGKQILSGIQGIAQPGQLMAIMGASGAGKTTFLDILARKNKRGMATGNFYVNGEKVSDEEYRSVIGFVDQEDTMLPTLTVHETILTSALLRLPRDMSSSAKEQRVFEVEKQLGIFGIRDQLIGSEEGNGRGVSGGEKRRVGIACELVTSPSILFLDEPTSGLDAFNAFNVIECLVSLAKDYNRTVIFTIHQPRSNIVALFDQLVLLAKGRTVYSGDFSKCQQFFDALGYACPPGFNIADYLVDLTMHVDSITSSACYQDEQDPVEMSPPGLRTDNSSTRAIKSISSVSILNGPAGANGSTGAESLRRPKQKRRDSLKQRQDRQLYTRKKSGTSTIGGVETHDDLRTGDDGQPHDSDSPSAKAQWLRLSRQRSTVTPKVVAASASTNFDNLVKAYASSEIAIAIHDNIETAIASAHHANGGLNGHSTANGNASVSFGTMASYRRPGWLAQFRILSVRTWRNLYRNPMLMLTHYAIAILLAVLCGFLFYGLTDDIKGFQNRLGLFFFVLALFGFSTLTSLTVFASERLLFVRERANGYYHPITYFAAKVIFDIVPLRLIPPIIMGSIVYPMVGLVPAWPEFLKFILVLVLFNLAAAAICLFIGVVCRDGGVANLIGSLVMLFSLLFAGLLLNHDAIPKPALWLQQLSIFHYGFEALIVNEVKYLTLIDHKFGLDIEVPGASILSSFGFKVLDLWKDVAGLAGFAAGGVGFAYGAMWWLLVEQR